MNPLLRFDFPLEEAFFLERRKRFLVHVERNNESFWIHTNNSGSMMGLLRAGRRVLISRSDNPKRKYAHTLEAVWLDCGWCGVNTLIPNRLLGPLFEQDILKGSKEFTELRTEVKVLGSRFDALLSGPGDARCWVEAKNVTLVEEDTAYFPDAVTSRGTRHLEDLGSMVERGDRALCVFFVQRADAACFAAADFIDPAYAGALDRARNRGVSFQVIMTELKRDGVYFSKELPVRP